MKQINYLLLASILFFSNCSNNNGIEEMLTEEIVNITEADLVGNWDFVSLEFEGKTYTECDDQLRKKYNLTNLSFFDVTLKSELYDAPTLIYFSNCGNTTSSEMKFKIEDEKLIFNDKNDYAYLILNYNEFNGKILRLKLLKNSSILPTGGIYTLKKRL